MRQITFAEFIAGAAISTEQLKVLRRRGQIACAFGRREAFQSLGFVALDCVATVLADRLATVFERTQAALLTRLHFDIWARVVAAAETDPAAPAFFAVAEFVDRKGRRTHVALGTRTDDPAAIKRDVDRATGLSTIHTVAVDVGGVIADVRANASAAGYDFAAPFLPPPGEKLDEILAPYAAERDRAISIAVKARRAGIKARELVEATGAAVQ